MGTQEDLAIYAQQQLGDVLDGISVFAGIEPDATYDPCVTFRTSGGEPPVYTYGQRTALLSRPWVMVWARSKVYGSAATLADRLYDLLQQSNTMINGTLYQKIRPFHEPQYWGPDPNNRQQVGFLVSTIHG